MKFGRRLRKQQHTSAGRASAHISSPPSALSSTFPRLTLPSSAHIAWLLPSISTRDPVTLYPGFEPLPRCTILTAATFVMLSMFTFATGSISTDTSASVRTQLHKHLLSWPSDPTTLLSNNTTFSHALTAKLDAQNDKQRHTEQARTRTLAHADQVHGVDVEVSSYLMRRARRCFRMENSGSRGHKCTPGFLTCSPRPEADLSEGSDQGTAGSRRCCTSGDLWISSRHRSSRYLWGRKRRRNAPTEEQTGEWERPQPMPAARISRVRQNLLWQ
jgi:flagellar hook-basal body complex protein FliE